MSDLLHRRLARRNCKDRNPARIVAGQKPRCRLPLDWAESRENSVCYNLLAPDFLLWRGKKTSYKQAQISGA
ncbi:MAG: hypothetical protein ACXWJW_10120 [Xanthobacteraceae bacterium]